MYLKKNDHVSRWAPYKKLLRDQNNKPLRLLPQAFEMTDKDNGKLSVNWLEYFCGSHSTNIIKTVQAYRKMIKDRYNGRVVGELSAFGIGNVGMLEDACAVYNYTKVRVVYDERKVEENNKSHARIIRLPLNNQDVMLTLASNVFTEIVPNKDIPPK